MIRTVYFACHLPRAIADSANLESGRIYTGVLVEHYRILRQSGVWLSPGAQERYSDFLNADTPKLLHSHSIDAAQQGFPKACKTARSARKAGLTDANFPHKVKRFRTTVWKGRNGQQAGKVVSNFRRQGDCLLLPMARGHKPVEVKLPAALRCLPSEAFTEMRLVYNKASRHYEWHLVVDDGIQPVPVQGGSVAGGDLGEIHPITLTDGKDAVVITCRVLRMQNQHTNHILAKTQTTLSTLKRGSRRSKRLIRRKVRFLAKQERRKRDILHKVSKAVVNWCVEHKVGTLAIGDVRDIADGKRLNKKSQQKISNWSHGKLRQFIGYKAESAGITVIDNVDEAYTSQTCAVCGNRYKPKGRVYRCPSCGSIVHRDVQGAANLLSRFLYGELAKVPVVEPKYRYPVLRGKRSSPGHGASSSLTREAAGL